MKKNIIVSGVIILVLVICSCFFVLNKKVFAKDVTEYKQLIKEAFQSENWDELNKYSDEVNMK